jgi:hypothetical protein
MNLFSNYTLFWDLTGNTHISEAFDYSIFFLYIVEDIHLNNLSIDYRSWLALQSNRMLLWTQLLISCSRIFFVRNLELIFLGNLVTVKILSLIAMTFFWFGNWRMCKKDNHLSMHHPSSKCTCHIWKHLILYSFYKDMYIVCASAPVTLEKISAALKLTVREQEWRAGRGRSGHGAPKFWRGEIRVERGVNRA